MKSSHLRISNIGRTNLEFTLSLGVCFPAEVILFIICFDTLKSLV